MPPLESLKMEYTITIATNAKITAIVIRDESSARNIVKKRMRINDMD
jgi:hypothetical protein